jgi:hypothetical protein
MIETVIGNLVIVAVGIMLVLLARALPRIDVSVLQTPEGKGKLSRIFSSELIERVDDTVSQITEKTFRKLRVGVLKFDNYLSSRIKKINEEAKVEEKKIDFEDIKDTEELTMKR